MTRAVVVYESMFGNSKAVAEAIAAGLGERVPVEVVGVDDARLSLAGEDVLLVIGGPTHAFSMSRATTRESAVQQHGAPGPAGSGIRDLLESLPPSAGAPAAAFDTRVKKKFVPGSAASSAEKRLRKLGYRMVVPAESFWVADMSGPLLDGELDRARAWGASLGAAASGSAATD